MTRQIPPALSGVFAALPTPYGPDGTPSNDALHRILDFLLRKRIKGFCIGGVTGEYASCSVEERISLFRSVALRADGQAGLILGVGAERVSDVLRLARAAADCGADAVLLPPPSFFRFESTDLVDFLRRTGADLPLPALLYNIPQFANKLGIENILHLIETVPNIIGVKDSSGQLLNLPLIHEAKTRTPMIFFIGSDELFIQALEHDADGTISGTASACPELMLAAHEAHGSGQQERATLLQGQIEEFCVSGAEFPSPWTIKLALKARGIDTGDWVWPVGEHMRLKMEKFQKWFSAWSKTCETTWSASGNESIANVK